MSPVTVYLRGLHSDVSRPMAVPPQFLMEKKEKSDEPDGWANGERGTMHPTSIGN